MHDIPSVMRDAAAAHLQMYELAYAQAQSAAALPGIDAGWFDI
jgi:hypothetical protein